MLRHFFRRCENWLDHVEVELLGPVDMSAHQVLGCWDVTRLRNLTNSRAFRWSLQRHSAQYLILLKRQARHTVQG
jgi:hypothetical protein